MKMLNLGSSTMKEKISLLLFQMPNHHLIFLQVWFSLVFILTDRNASGLEHFENQLLANWNIKLENDGDWSRDRNRYKQFVPVSQAAQEPWKLDIGPLIIQCVNFKLVINCNSL